MIYAKKIAQDAVLHASQAGDISTEGSARFQSKMTTNEIFTGEYFDDFAIPPSFVASEDQNVLLLGGGLGSGIRPLFAGGRVQSLIAVDYDQHVSDTSSAIFKQFFGELPVQFETCCANEFIERQKQKFDLIWVDLFDSSGFASIMASRNFFEKCANQLNRGGLIAVNIYGISNFLMDYSQQDPLDYFVSILSDNFLLHTLDHRKNITLIVRPKNAGPLKLFESYHSELNTIDRVSLKLLLKRASFARPLTLEPDRHLSDKSFLQFSSIMHSEQEAFERFKIKHHALFSTESQLSSDDYLADAFADMLLRKDEDARFLFLLRAAQSRSAFLEIDESLILVTKLKELIFGMSEEFRHSSIYQHLLAMATPRAGSLDIDQRIRFCDWIERFESGVLT